MKDTRLALLVGSVLLFVTVPLSATPAPVPFFNECPQTGHALGCSYLLVFGTHGSVNILFDQNVKDVDGQENVLVGIQNNSGSYINLAGYNGPNKIFSGIHLGGGLGDRKSTYLVIKDSGEHDDGKDDDNERDEEDGPRKMHTPEPSSMALLGTGIMVLGGILRRRLLA